QHIPVIMISASQDMERIVQCIEMGAEDYLEKPFNLVLLKARVSACLEKKRFRDQEKAHHVELERRIAEATGEIRQNSSFLERRLRELGAMIDVSTAMISVLDLDVLLNQIMDLSKEVMNAEASSLLLLDPESGDLKFHVARGAAGEAIKSFTVEMGHGIAGWVAQTGQALLTPDAYQEPRFDPTYDRKTGFRTRSLLTVPIKVKDETIGVVQVINKQGQNSFDEHDLDLFQSFAGMAGISLDNARLFDETRRMAEALRNALEKERWLSIEKEKLGAYIPKHLRDEISRNREQTLALGGKVAHASILFSDIEGFTAISESLSPSHVVSFLNQYMTAMAHVIEEEGGILDKFIGDAIMAIFLAGEAYPEHHAIRAVRAGIRMQQALADLRDRWRTERPELPEVRVRIGVNTGDVVAGNVGSETRMDYTVIGDNVNVAQRLETNARTGEVLVSEATHEQIKHCIPAIRMEPIIVKNRVQPVQVYAIRPPVPSAS
ncbi:MAG TPA: adenylate/guanylate cyclase domain-containing protein, partial [Armatimonadota bacterium]|nr:adenylate/guanylate cyclase domain-containing protein [Armatimonadota bacterium]